MTTITDTVQTTASQVRALGIRGKLVQIDGDTLRISQKRGGFVYNTDVAYDRGWDLYNVTVYKIDSRIGTVLDENSTFGEVVAERTYAGVYADQLGELVGAV